MFEEMMQWGHEQVVFCCDKKSNLKAIIAIHDTTLGPALGGVRKWQYANESDALNDVLRLSRGMTYKSAAAGLNVGGGKGVILDEKPGMCREDIFKAFGRFVNSLNGRYITAEDVGTSVADMKLVRQETKYVTGLPREDGSSGDPSPLTALGVYEGIKACVKEIYKDESLKKKKIAIQGLGNVGFNLASYLVKDGAEVIGSDIKREKCEKAKTELGIRIIDDKGFYNYECDIFSPCALGAILNDEIISALSCKIVAGAANNQLKEDRHGELLKQRGILYAPDFIINAGGVINISVELEPGGYDINRAEEKVKKIYDNVTTVIAIAKERGISTHKAAEIMAEERLKNKQGFLSVESGSRFMRNKQVLRR